MFNIFKKSKQYKIKKSYIRGPVATDSGILCIWDFQSFKDIKDTEAWENAFLKDTDIIGKIKDNLFVPINIDSDGRLAI